MNVLIACEESQRVCIEFRKRGHNAFSCDLLDCSGGYPEWHIKQDVVPLLNGNCSFFTADNKFHSVYGQWDMVIAFPPCTYLSKASARWMFPKGVLCEERYNKMLAARSLFFLILQCNCEKIVIENPRPLKIANLPVCSQIIQPYYFGEPYSKTTFLWLKGVLPLKSTNVLKQYSSFIPSNTGGINRGQKNSCGSCKRSKNDSIERSKTFLGVAAAMAEQWG